MSRSVKVTLKSLERWRPQARTSHWGRRLPLRGTPAAYVARRRAKGRLFAWGHS